MTNWNDDAKVCGNCAFWPLGGYQHDWEGCEPLGIAGYGTDGTVSECRRHAPVVGRHSPGRSADWPQTEKLDSCGDFQHRTATHRRTPREPS